MGQCMRTRCPKRLSLFRQVQTIVESLSFDEVKNFEKNIEDITTLPLTINLFSGESKPLLNFKIRSEELKGEPSDHTKKISQFLFAAESGEANFHFILTSYFLKSLRKALPAHASQLKQANKCLQVLIKEFDVSVTVTSSLDPLKLDTVRQGLLQDHYRSILDRHSAAVHNIKHIEYNHQTRSLTFALKKP